MGSGGNLTKLAIERRMKLMELLQDETSHSQVSSVLQVSRQWGNKILHLMKERGEVYITRWERQKNAGPPVPFFKMRLNEEHSAPRPKPIPRKILDKERYKKIYSDPIKLAKKNKARNKREKQRKKEDPEYVLKRRSESKARYARTKTVVKIDPILAAIMGVK